MKNILKLVAAALLCTTLLSSCMKDLEPTSGITSEQMEGHLDALVDGIPAAMMQIFFAGVGDHSDFGYPSLMIARESMGEDFVAAGNLNANWFFYYSSNQGWGYTDNAPYHFWNSYYPWIKACNDVIRKAKALDQNNGTIQSYLGVAYAFRASFYLDLVRMYEYKSNKYTDPYLSVPLDEIEGLSIPIVTEETTELMAANNPRVKAEKVYEQIFSDLKLAEGYLANYSRLNPMMPNLAVVYGLYARAYLERGAASDDNYRLAAEYARKAITASGCTPLNQTQWEDPASGFNSYGSQNSWMWCLVQLGENVSNLLNFVANMSNEQTFGYGQLGNGVSFCISKALYDRIPDNDFRKHSWIDPNRKYYNYQISYSNRDEFLKSVPNYANIKFRVGSGNETTPIVGAATDIPLMRVEEMYLIEAEAAGKINLSEGKRLLNEFMRYRIVDGSYDCSRFGTFEDFRKELILQKRIEFWGEGLILYDYKRLELGMNRGYSESNHVPLFSYNCEKIAPWWNLCIPRSEIQNNPGIPLKLNNPDPTGTVDVR